jgi:hypothetical protein
VSELRSAVESSRAEVLPDLPDVRIEEDFSELQRVSELLEVERRRVFERDGHLSVASWLASVFRVGWGAARDEVRVARVVEGMPETRRALEAGDISMSAVRVLVSARDADPEAFAHGEAQLMEAARIHSIGDLQRARPTGGKGSNASRHSGGRKDCGSAAGSTPRSRCWGWCASRAIWTRRTVSRCSLRCTPCSMPRHAPVEPTTPARLRSVGRTRSGRSAANGSTASDRLPWRESGPTSR